MAVLETSFHGFKLTAQSRAALRTRQGELGYVLFPTNVLECSLTRHNYPKSPVLPIARHDHRHDGRRHPQLSTDAAGPLGRDDNDTPEDTANDILFVRL